jgi:hypothetical protein|uniref:Uncharacterized protein n=1 Tax=Eutreptiella gymnastica TaxID=73025 RepID=A0A7S4GD25_9EUGL
MNARTRARETHSDESEAGSELRRETPSGGPEPGSELCELSSDESVPEALNRNRDEKQRQKYEQLFGETHVPHTPWERLENGEVACHVTKLVFATAVQCINHKRTQQYQRGLAASDLQQDEDVLVELEKQARAEKDRFIQQKHALVKETNIAKQTLRAETAHLAKAVRQKEHDLLMAKAKIAKMQTQHERQIAHIKSTYQRKIDALIRLMDEQSKGGSQTTAKEPGKACRKKSQGLRDLSVPPHCSPVSTPSPKPEAKVPECSALKMGPNPWAPIEFDAMVGLHKMSLASAQSTKSKNAVPNEVMQAFLLDMQVPANMTPPVDMSDCGSVTEGSGRSTRSESLGSCVSSLGSEDALCKVHKFPAGALAVDAQLKISECGCLR